MKINSLLLLGTLPPPIGGVTISVKNQLTALLSKNINVRVYPKGLLSKSQIAHVHSYQPWKRFILLSLGKLLAKRNVFTIHGMHFDEKNYFNRLNIRLTDGIVIQNDEVVEQAPLLNMKPLLKMTSLVKEGIEPLKKAQSILGVKDKPRLLLYAQHNGMFDGQYIYGVPFIISILPKLQSRYTLVFADVQNSYPEMSSHFGDDVIHLTEPVNFKQLLSEVDIYIRPTSKDGDAISILESLMIGIPVLASNVVKRAEGASIYNFLDEDDFLRSLEELMISPQHTKIPFINSVDDYLYFYEKLLFPSCNH